MTSLTAANSGASRTPASPAMKLDSIHETVPTRSASTPASSVMRGLSTTARIWSPRAVDRNSTVSPTTMSTVSTMVTSWLLSMVIWPTLWKSSDASPGGRCLAPAPRSSFTIEGMATSRPSDVTSLATGGAVRRWRYNPRSRIQPSSGATITTETTNAGSVGQPRYSSDRST